MESYQIEKTALKKGLDEESQKRREVEQALEKAQGMVKELEEEEMARKAREAGMKIKVEEGEYLYQRVGETQSQVLKHSTPLGIRIIVTFRKVRSMMKSHK